MKRWYVLFFLAVSICCNTNAHSYEYPWKTLPPFEISRIDGYQGTYNAGEQISFYVEGTSRVDTTPDTGFTVAATIYDVPRSKPVKSAAGKFDKNRHAWLVTLPAPNDNTKTYEIELRLFCGNDDSQCADIYGRAARLEKRLPLQVR